MMAIRSAVTGCSGNPGGLGQLINELAERYDLAGMYAAICFVILVSISVFLLTERLERWLRPVD